MSMQMPKPTPMRLQTSAAKLAGNRTPAFSNERSRFPHPSLPTVPAHIPPQQTSEAFESLERTMHSLRTDITRTTAGFTLQSAPPSPLLQASSPSPSTDDSQMDGTAVVSDFSESESTDFSDRDIVGILLQQMGRFADFFDRRPDIHRGEQPITPEMRVLLPTMRASRGYLTTPLNHQRDELNDEDEAGSDGGVRLGEEVALGSQHPGIPVRRNTGEESLSSDE